MQHVFIQNVLNVQGLWDTAGQEDYDRLRPLSYPQTDVFIVMYSITSRSSFDNVTSCWLPEIAHHCKPVDKMAVIVVGNKSDLKGQRAVPTQEAVDMAKQHGVCFVEISALTQHNLKFLFDTVVRYALNFDTKMDGANTGCCPLLCGGCGAAEDDEEMDGEDVPDELKVVMVGSGGVGKSATVCLM